VDNRKRLIKSIEIIGSSIRFFDNNKTVIPFPHRDGINALFFTNRDLDKFFVEMIPTNQLDSFIQLLFFMGNICSQMGERISSTSTTYEINIVKEQLKNLLGILSSRLNSDGMFNIFYSWQSDLPNTTNRNFIESTLNKGIKQINDEFSLNLKIDQDTREVAGSPDVIRAIFEKIDKCFIFVGDVSIVFKSTTKAYPNSNVLFELGYAIKSIGDRNVLMVFNEATGATQELPFDLGLKRQIKYCCSNDISAEEKKEEKERLVNDFYNAIKLVLNSVL
jgi:hypothetical protein